MCNCAVARRGECSQDVDLELEAVLTSVTVSGLELQTTMRLSEVVYQVRLKGFQVINPDQASGASQFRHMATVDEQQEALVLSVSLYNNATDDENCANMDAVDMAIRLSTGQLKAVFVKAFVQRVVSFVNHFQSAKTAVIEASSAAALAAKENVQRAYIQASRLALDIQLKAPHIIVPHERHALIVDLGYLTVRNRFDLRPHRNEIGSPAIVDSIQLKLEDLRLSLALLQGVAIASEVSFLKPLTFCLLIGRNLSSSWYTDEPELSVDVQLGHVAIVLSQQVYAKVVDVVLDSLEPADKVDDGDDVTVSTSATIVGASDGSAAAQHSGNVAAAASLLHSTDLSTEAMLQMYGSLRVALSFGVTLQEIKVDLFSDASSTKGVVATFEKPLARLAVRGFTVTGNMKSDDSIDCKVALLSCLLEDTRPTPSTPSTPVTSPTTTAASIDSAGQRPLSRLLHPTTEQGCATHDMLTLDYKRKSGGDCQVEIHLYGFTLILCPNYLIRLLNFFTAPMPQTKKPTAAAKEVVVVVAGGAPSPASSLMDVRIVCDKPDVFLVEHMDDVNTNALVLNMEVLVQLLITCQATDVCVLVSRLHIFSCVFDPEQRAKSMAQVLSPCRLDVKAKMGQSQEEHLLQVNVDVQRVTLSVSPGTIEMLANISKSMAMDEDDVVQEALPAPDFSTLWAVKPLHSFSLPFLDADEAVEAAEYDVVAAAAAAAAATAPAPRRTEQAVIVLRDFKMIIETGVGKRTSPLILFESSANAQVKNWSTGLEASASVSVSASYYNSILALWEPLLEPVDHVADGQVTSSGPWTLLITLKRRLFAGADLELDQLESFDLAGQVDVHPLLEITFESDDNMELTVTRSFLDVVSMLSQAFSDAVKQQLSKRQMPAAHYVVRNDLDRAVVLGLRNSPPDYCSDLILDDCSIKPVSEVVIIFFFVIF